jgi:mono/diheme cytochrome c family protein
MKQSPWLVLVPVLFATGSSAAGEKSSTASPLTYEKHVRPIFKAYCFQCHGEGEKLKGRLDLRLRRLLVEGGESGPAVLPGQREKSLLYERIHNREMPPGKKKLSKADIELIGRWIAQGARVGRPEPKQVGRGLLITAEEQAFWAFQPIRRSPVPRLGSDRLRTPIDSFLLEKLHEKKLSFSPEADRGTLTRRAYFDLLGLPPSPEEVRRFLADRAPDAYERLIDRLLASPRYGERWGRHWLDVAGYADSEGYTPDDPVRRYAYKYRDYVIRSLNTDKPFDRFIQEQLAGDEMIRPPYRNLTPGAIDKLVATGFLRMAPDGTGSRGVDQGAARNQVIADTIKIVSTSLMGLTVGCAQCHNHRYDPIPQTDYYRLRAIFEPAYDCKNWRVPLARRISLYTDADRQKAAQIEAKAARVDAERLRKQAQYINRTLEKELAKLPEKLRQPIRIARSTPPAKRTPQQQQLLKEYPSVNVSAGSLYLYDHQAAEDLKKDAARAAAIRAAKPVEEFIRALTEVPGHVPVTHLFYRGDHTQPRQAVPPGGLTILASSRSKTFPARNPALPTTGRRLAFARWLTDGKHSLTARVLVNRVWMQHFGRGLVGTPGDFGFLGERPSHPGLLDWLADDFMAGGWRLKRLHRLIMTSTAYRQVSRRDGPQGRIDPDNRLCGRMPVRRLEAEAVRDAILAITGKFNGKMFGTPVPVMEDEVGQFVIGIENKNGENRPGPIIPLHGEEYRRSVYVQVRRSRPLGMLETFDAPAMDPNCAARNASTVAPQALMFMNSEFIVTQAGYFAERVRREAGMDRRAQVTRAWTLAFGSEAGDADVKDAQAFLTEQETHLRKKNGPATGKPDPRQQALASFCQTLLSSNQFLYVD